jgi:ribonuclease P protein component
LSDKPATLTQKSDIQLLFREGKRSQTKLLTFLYKRNSLDFNRYLYCSDRTSKGAVKRNRVKRVLRAHVQEIHSNLKSGFDMGLIASYSFTEMNFLARKQMLLKLFRAVLA